ncbi:uncharacterized protein [Rutidosis leptorrhynchoides]|uniref:uncharacterized protein n=1 Tax=Rutidosis leptorrhynchoides TaxID=125765 RepID=UPI003A98F189
MSLMGGVNCVTGGSNRVKNPRGSSVPKSTAKGKSYSSSRNSKNEELKQLISESSIGRFQMKIISLNIRGFGSGKESKFGDVRKLRILEKPSIFVLQETKCHNKGDNWVFGLWGSKDCGYVQKEMVGKSGGQLIIWDKNIFEVSGEQISDYFVAIWGTWKDSGSETIIVNVYGPDDDVSKRKMWDSLNNILSISGVSWVICGDFNEVRDCSERLNCEFFEKQAKMFNEFINQNMFVDIPIGGRKFTRVSDDSVKMSKFDRILVSGDFLDLWSDLKVNSLDRMVSDHCPIMLSDGEVNFGPKPFKVFDDWFSVEGVDQVIADSWWAPLEGNRKDCGFHNKLKRLKEALKD